MANLEGTYSVSNYEAIRVVVDLSKKIYMLNPAATPFLTFGQKLEGDDCTNREFHWVEDAFLGWTDTAKSAAANNATTVYVTNADRYGVDMIVWNKTTDERMLVCH